jgi:hypothetical protein
MRTLMLFWVSIVLLFGLDGIQKTVEKSAAACMQTR